MDMPGPINDVFLVGGLAVVCIIAMLVGALIWVVKRLFRKEK